MEPEPREPNRVRTEPPNRTQQHEPHEPEPNEPEPNGTEQASRTARTGTRRTGTARTASLQLNLVAKAVFYWPQPYYRAGTALCINKIIAGNAREVEIIKK